MADDAGTPRSNSQDPGPGPGPGQGDVSAETGLAVPFSTPPIGDSINSTDPSIEPPPPTLLTPQPRPSLHERTATESSLPPHHRLSVIAIPVTPGIDARTYFQESGPSPQASGSYFCFHPPKDVAASPDSLDDNTMSSSAPQGAADAAAMSGHDILRRMSRSSRGRRESLSDIRAAHPSLTLTGNVISATFSMPHSLKYRKGADWVRTQLCGPPFLDPS